MRNATKRFQKPTYSIALDATAGAAAEAAVSGELDELLSKILPLEQADKGFRCVFQPLRDGLAILDLAARNPADELRQRLRPQLHAVGNDEALHLDTVRQDRLEGFDAIGLGGVVLRDQAAH